MIVYAVVFVVYEICMIVGFACGWLHDIGNFIAVTMLMISNFVTLVALRKIVKKNEALQNTLLNDTKEEK